jgi:hypothetical protein
MHIRESKQQQLQLKWQVSQELGEENVRDPGRYLSGQWEDILKVTAREVPPRRISRLEMRLPHSKALGIFAMVFASIGFVTSIVGIIWFVNAWKDANVPEMRLAGAVELAGSIVLMLISLVIFVVGVAVLALWRQRRRRWSQTRM